MTAQRVRGIAEKRQWEDVRNVVPEDECLSGNELVAEREKAGDGTSFRFGPTKLTWTEARILAAVCYAMLWRFQSRKRSLGRCRGLIATLHELGQHNGAGITAIGEASRKLQALGWLLVTPHFVKFKAVHNRRGNCYRITAELAQAFDLEIPRGVVLPHGVPSPGIASLPESGRQSGKVCTSARRRGKHTSASGMPSGCSPTASPGNRVPESVAGAASLQPDLSRVKARPAALSESSEGESRDEIRAMLAELVATLDGGAS